MTENHVRKQKEALETSLKYLNGTEVVLSPEEYEVCKDILDKIDYETIQEFIRIPLSP